MQQPPFREVLHDVLVGVLDELAGEGVVAGDEAGQVYGLNEGQFLFAAQAQVLVPEGRSDVNDAGAVFHGDEIAGDYPGSEIGG